jgi:hypothetical protein
MSALGHEQTLRHVHVMSVIPLKADIHRRGLHVRLVPLADIADPNASGRRPPVPSAISRAGVSSPAPQIQTRFVRGAVLKFQTTRKILPCGRGCVFSGPAGSVLSTCAADPGASRTFKTVSISGEIDVNRI